MDEFQQTLTNILARHGVSRAELARLTGYAPLLVERISTGKSRQVPVDFFIRVADALELSEEEKDGLVRSWAFGVERWRWR
jgi:transcriptional regulator with XRE-family HTH domain